MDITLVGTERIGQLSGDVDPQGWPVLVDTTRWGANGFDLGANVWVDGRTYFVFGDTNVADQNRQAFNSDVIAWSDDPAVLRHGGHVPIGWNFVLPNDHQGATATTGQPGWRLCAKCNCLFVPPDAGATGSRCAYDNGTHTAIGWNFVLPNDHQGATAQTGQPNWRMCANCHALFFSGDGQPHGRCPAGGPHAPLGWNFALPNDHQGATAQTGQPNWRLCSGCGTLFWAGDAIRGVCPATSSGGGLRLQPVLGADRNFFPFTGADPVGITESLENVGGVFAHDGQLYAFANISDPRFSGHPRFGIPSYGCYMLSTATPDAPAVWRTDFQFSPRIGVCVRPGGSHPSHAPLGRFFVLPWNQAGTHDQPGWHVCVACASLVATDAGPGRCFGTGAGHVPADALFRPPTGTTDDDQHQSHWQRCDRCQTMVFSRDPQDQQGACPAGGGHRPGGTQYTLDSTSFEATATAQRDWRFCGKCAGLFWSDVALPCPDGGTHQAIGLEFVLTHDVPADAHQQSEWRYCGKCSGLFLGPTPGICPADGRGHVAGAGPDAPGYDFALSFATPADGEHQDGWRQCDKCSGLYWSGAGGVCPADRKPHTAGLGLNLVLAHNPAEDVNNQANWRSCQYCFGLHWTGQPDLFAGVAPYVVRTADHPWLPPSPSGWSAVLLGFSFSGFRLAAMALPAPGTGQIPLLEDTRYYNRAAAQPWSPDVNAATVLFEQPTNLYTSHTLHYLPGPRLWMMLYSQAIDIKGDDAKAKPVVARFAASPMDLGTARDCTIFDPASAYGVYANDADNALADRLGLGKTDRHKGWPYGIYPLERYVHWDGPAHSLTIYYVLSLSSPYQVQLMRSQLTISP